MVLVVMVSLGLHSAQNLLSILTDSNARRKKRASSTMNIDRLGTQLYVDGVTDSDSDGRMGYYFRLKYGYLIHGLSH